MNKRLWHYQLQDIDPYEIHEKDPVGLIMDPMDLAAESKRGQRLLTTRKDGRLRHLWAYLSIGEAETYRDYWDPDTSYLLEPNPEWPDNITVKFWEPEWQNIVFNAVSDIHKLPFTGIYFDKADAYEDLERTKRAGQGRDLEKDMANFIIHLCRLSESLHPDISLIMQNALELLYRPDITTALDAVFKEDLFYGDPVHKAKNNTQTITEGLKALRHAHRNGLGTGVIEYVDGQHNRPGLDRLFNDTAIRDVILPKSRELDK